ncbi:MAG: DUF29 domain-containing protein [Rhodospirillales bacterium]
MSVSYEADYYAWTVEQVTLLRQGRLNDADIAHIAEELEDLGKAEKRELRNRLAVLLAHLLKWQAQPGGRGASWQATIREQRLRLADHLADDPSLRPTVSDVVAQVWPRAVVVAMGQTKLAEELFPTSCPWSAEQVIDAAFWPGGEG